MAIPEMALLMNVILILFYASLTSACNALPFSIFRVLNFPILFQRLNELHLVFSIYYYLALSFLRLIEVEHVNYAKLQLSSMTEGSHISLYSFFFFCRFVPYAPLEFQGTC